ncbi:dicarboxylate/amino acid:cation symporter [Sansalvadorimonas sp. 2012CJ34-2]|uniref:Dicarboxylate/amino acid:cation symporter n=1 Tax=Parendozoicomonas callyspongiae TaxID=2942213 RepID=A0ABT0PIL2_9GAMM|nr:dicarboxylate/amino acid:cation symporter [Sansalvadorimonas sp. 2012CJ34-2]
MIEPGSGTNLGLADAGIALSLKEPPSLLTMVVGIVPANPFKAFVAGNILQILFMAIMTGVAIKKLENHDTHSASKAFAVANNLMMKLTTMIMSLAPVGVFALTARMAATLDINSILSVMSYVGTGVIVMMIWLFLFYPAMIFLTTGRSPVDFLQKTREQIVFALSTASSNAREGTLLKAPSTKLQQRLATLVVKQANRLRPWF